MPSITRNCKECGRAFQPLGGNVRAGWGWFCRKGCATGYRNRLHPKTAEDFWANVDRSGGNWKCWIWQKSITGAGYGQLMMRGRRYSAHRYAYENCVRLIPKGMHIDHLCRNKRCVNPCHLQLVTPRVNTLRGIGPGARNAAKTECHRGHLLAGGNLYVTPDGRRQCNACNRMRERAYRKREVEKSLQS